MIVKKAMILAAGLGSRLGSLTQEQPKALVKVGAIPMIDRLLIKLQEVGIEEVMINLHHLADMIKTHVNNQTHNGIEIRFSHETDLLLDTGGALVAAKNFFRGDLPVLIHNVDILTNLDISVMTDYHLKHQAQATLFVSGRSSQRALLFDKNFQLCGWTNLKTDEIKWVNHPSDNLSPLAYNGVWLAQPEFIHQIPFKEKFSIIDAWLHMAKNKSVIGYRNDQVSWHDLGTVEKISHAEDQLNLKKP
jgi:NDP-sugar pyrophosphorylase family protein